MRYIDAQLVERVKQGDPEAMKLVAAVLRGDIPASEEPLTWPAGIDTSNDVCTTIAVSVTVKIDAHGATPDELISHAVNSAMNVIEDGLAATYQPSPSSDKYVWATFSPGVGNVESSISVEGATALVNHTELEKLFEGR